MTFLLSTQTEADAVREAEAAIERVGLYLALKQYCTLCSMCSSFIRFNEMDSQPVYYWKEYLERKLNVWEHLQKVQREQPGLYSESKVQAEQAYCNRFGLASVDLGNIIH